MIERMADRILFTVRDGRTLPASTWETFVAKTREAGSTPARVLRELIEAYNERPDRDTTIPQDRQ
jgi:hypothetical protein